jgi:hypothetical protein
LEWNDSHTASVIAGADSGGGGTMPALVSGQGGHGVAAGAGEAVLWAEGADMALILCG